MSNLDLIKHDCQGKKKKKRKCTKNLFKLELEAHQPHLVPEEGDGEAKDTKSIKLTACIHQREVMLDQPDNLQ